jgi:hypothetical protein
MKKALTQNRRFGPSPSAAPILQNIRVVVTRNVLTRIGENPYTARIKTIPISIARYSKVVHAVTVLWLTVGAVLALTVNARGQGVFYSIFLEHRRCPCPAYLSRLRAH